MSDNVGYESTQPLHTTDSLTSDLRRLGVSEGMTLIVHSSLRSIGKVMGGTVSVILALERNIGERGTRAGQYLQGGGGRAAG